MDFHGPQANRVAQILHNQAHEIGRGLQAMYESGADEHELGTKRIMQEDGRLRETISRYHQATGKAMTDEDGLCTHCGEEI